jgi:hypothetical protein
MSDPHPPIRLDDDHRCRRLLVGGQLHRRFGKVRPYEIGDFPIIWMRWPTKPRSEGLAVQLSGIALSPPERNNSGHPWRWGRFRFYQRKGGAFGHCDLPVHGGDAAGINPFEIILNSC